MEHLFIFTGLGADERVFAEINFGDHHITHIEWKLPATGDMISYAKELAKQINVPDPILIGLLFGGMLAVEVSKIVKTKKIILISSAANRDQIPAYYRVGSLLKVIPAKLLKQPIGFLCWMFGLKLPTHRKLLREILKDTNPFFLKWAIRQIIGWNNTDTPINCVKIHGSADRVLPTRLVPDAILINGGGHLMVVTHAAEVSAIIQSILSPRNWFNASSIV